MNCVLKIFVSILLLIPVLVVSILLSVLAIIVNCFTIIYFILIGWTCEVKICVCCCHGPFIEGALKCPWNLLINFWKKICNFLCEKTYPYPYQYNVNERNPVIVQYSNNI